MLTSPEPTDIALKEVLERHRQALGGLGVLRATALHRQDGRITGVNPQITTIWNDELGNRMRVDIEVPALGLKMTKGFDGRNAWESGPMYDGYYGTSHPESLRIARQLAPLWCEEPDRTSAQLLGASGDAAGRRCYIIERLERNEADQEVPVRHFVDSGTWLLREMRRGANEEEIQIFDDYRDVGGRPFPFRTIVKQNMGDHAIVFESVSIIDADDSRFRHPSKGPPTEARPAAAHPDVAALEAIWETIAEVHFDATFGGLDWREVLERYRPAVASLDGGGSQAFADAAMRMIRELRATHYVVVPRAHVRSGDARVEKAGRVGLGLRWIEGGGATVYEREPDTPAAASPLRPGFVVTALNGRDDAALHARHGAAISHSPNELHARIVPYTLELRVHAGASVVVDYEDGSGHPGRVTLVAIERERQLNHRFKAQRKGSALAITFRVFAGDVVDRFGAALREGQDASGLVIDLRGNPGGVAQLPVDIASLLVTEKTSLGQFLYRNHQSFLPVAGRPDAWTRPVAILLDSMSGSCSELFAGSLQEMGRARVFGRPSAGAVLPSTEILLPNGCSFQYVVCDYRTAGGRRIEGVGVPPDVEVPLTREDLLEGRDPDMEAALGWLAAASPR